METHLKTLFLRDRTLFILKDGVEYEVSNPEVVIATLWEWPYGVELHEIPDGGRDMSGPPYSIVDFKTVARLLPKEKKEGSLYAGDNLHPRVEDIEKAEGDYRQFEDKKNIGIEFNHTIIDEGIHAPVESQEELWGAVIETVQGCDSKGVTFRYLVNHFTITRNPPV